MSKLFNSSTGYVNINKTALLGGEPYKNNIDYFITKEDKALYNMSKISGEKFSAIIAQEKEKALKNLNIPQDKKGDKETIMNAIDNASFKDLFYSRLEFMAPELRKDCEVMLSIANKYSSLNALEGFWKQFVPTELKLKKEFVLGLIKHNGQMIKILSKTSSKFIKDKDVAIESIKQDYNNSKYIHVDLLNDKDVCIAIVSKKGSAINRIDYYDFDIGLAAVRQNGLTLPHIPLEDRQKPEMSLEALKSNITAWKYVPMTLKCKKSFALQVVDTISTEILPRMQYSIMTDNKTFIVKNWNEDIDIGLKALSKSSKAYNFLSEDLKINPEINHAYIKAKAQEEESE